MERGDLIGAILDGRYRVIEPVAEGAMGVVYRAERVKLGRIVAIKVLHDVLPHELSGRKRFEIEAMAMAKLEHPHCASVLDVGVHNDRPFVVMDFVSGQNLKSLIANGPQPIPRATEIVRQVLSGLAHAHELGIIHRDIKPANIVLSQKIGLGDHVKILDFGLARLQDAGQSLTSGIVVGTPAYMAPEQIRGRALDGRVDLYACGVLLFELLTGQKPFHSENDDPLEVCRMHLHAPIPRLDTKLPGVQFGALEAVVAKALAKQSDDRYASAQDYAAALDDVVPRRSSTQPLPQVPRSGSVQVASADVLAVNDASYPPAVEVRSDDVMSAMPADPSHASDGDEAPARGARRGGVEDRGARAKPEARGGGAEDRGARAKPEARSGGVEGGARAEREARSGGVEGGARGESEARSGGVEDRGARGESEARSGVEDRGARGEFEARRGGVEDRGARGEFEARSGGVEDRGVRAESEARRGGVEDRGVRAESEARRGGVEDRGARAESEAQSGGMEDRGARAEREVRSGGAVGGGGEDRGARAKPELPSQSRSAPGTFFGLTVSPPPALGVRAASASGRPRSVRWRWAAVVAAVAVAGGIALAVMTTRGGPATPGASTGGRGPTSPRDPGREIAARANDLVAQSEREEALELLQRSRKQYPESASLAYATGRIFFSKFYWTDGLKNFRDAIRNDPTYRTDPELIKTVLRGFLTTPGYNDDLAGFLREDIGSAAQPFLEETVRDHPSAAIRSRAASELRRYR